MLARAPVVSAAGPRAASRCSTVVVRAEAAPQTRRSLLGMVGLGLAAGTAALLPAQEAAAWKLPSQDFTGGLVRGGGNVTKSATKASSEGYNLEGTKKQGISPKKRAKILAQVRSEAAKKAAS